MWTRKNSIQPLHSFVCDAGMTEVLAWSNRCMMLSFGCAPKVVSRDRIKPMSSNLFWSFLLSSVKET